MYIDQEGNRVFEVGEEVYDMYNRQVVITRTGMSASLQPKYVYELNGFEFSYFGLDLRGLEEGPFAEPFPVFMAPTTSPGMNKDIKVGQQVYVKNGVLTTVKRIFKDVDLGYRAYFDIDEVELWAYVGDCRTLEEGPQFYQTPPPVFAEGDQIYEKNNHLVVVTRTEIDEDGFLRIYYDLDDQGEMWSFAVECRTLEQGPLPGPMSRAAK